MTAATLRFPADRPRSPAARWLLLPAVFLLVTCFLAPLLIFFSYGLRGFVDSRITDEWTLSTAASYLGDSYHRVTLINSIILGVVVTTLTLVFAYPAALYMASRRGSRSFAIIGLIVFSPILVSIIVRAYGWQLLLSNNGVINYALSGLGLADRPVRLMFNWFGVIVSMIHVEIPFMFFPLLTVLMQIPSHLRDAAKDLGASDFAVWRRVVLPLSLPGVLAGSQIVFTTAISAFASPTILGGGRVQVMPVAIYQNILGLNWPLGAVQSVTLLLLSLALVALFTRALGPHRGRR
jgi:putative spermidine/putrescine transport system permease protein